MVMRSARMELGHALTVAFVVGAGGLRCWVRGIADNGIGEQGAAALAEALKENSTLRSLNLRSKCVGEEAAEGGEAWAGAGWALRLRGVRGV